MYKNYQMSDDYFDAKVWIDKYPFLRIKDTSYTYHAANTDKACWLNDIPLGWIKGFGKQMCDELLEALGEYVDDFIIAQLKEKFGELRAYWYWVDKDYSTAESIKLNQLKDILDGIISKYTIISRQTCYICGTSNAHMYYGAWIIPMCTDCEKKYRW